ncbi:BgTH12-05679 [Blumeria graminis f. sp. triticale]|uniref:Bgt-1226 n=3 Tax=Blumeria graminis TaxID=34373 RepID=A0A061HJ47_BLUGR|nr:hypothetical protein BGT96224_1226 [Blumeria graminis f. sp. tritici 96224]CAD6503936.1 BgTH12-05679 [Blumeria graminis f. sp. triticale]VDB90646.1 Bgt-1226 [Blumeria graminis f. sp. tritici]
MAQSQPSNIGFGFTEKDYPRPFDKSSEMTQTKSTMIQNMTYNTESLIHPTNNLQSPTFAEEQVLFSKEESTAKEQARDLKVKMIVRVAKFVIRGVSFSCSLVVLTMVSLAISVFNVTKHLPPRNHLPPWATGTKTWPQVLVLAISCTSLSFCIIIFWSYYRGGHRRAEKVAVYYTLFAIAFFILNTVMWAVAAGILQSSRSSGQNKDLWGWSCVDNKRRRLFSEKVDYVLICKMQNWVMVCCIIEIVLESITILLYTVIFYRYYTKQRLRKSMDVRDRARADLVLAQTRCQSNSNPSSLKPPLQYQDPNTPRSPLPLLQTQFMTKEGVFSNDTRFVEVSPHSPIPAKPFYLQPVPNKGLSTTQMCSQPNIEPTVLSPYRQTGLPNEQKYSSVSIPCAYTMPHAFQSLP